MIRPATPRYANVAPAVLNVTADAASVDLGRLLGQASPSPSPGHEAPPPSSPPAVIQRRQPAKVYEPRRSPMASRKRDRIYKERVLSGQGTSN